VAFGTFQIHQPRTQPGARANPHVSGELSGEIRAPFGPTRADIGVYFPRREAGNPAS
jgi:hypothetical protein